jgi:deoxyribodipyrimidine photo-lyase
VSRPRRLAREAQRAHAPACGGAATCSRSWSGATSITRCCTTTRTSSAQLQAEYDRISWEHGKHADALFAAWCEGRTGYPLVDAAMAQINQSGYMHNRLRMVVASFLVKDLGIDWRRGEHYFATSPQRLRPCREQRRLAMGSIERLRRAALLPGLQPGQPEPPVRRARQVHPTLPAAAREAADELIHAPWEARPIDLESAGVTLGRDYPEPIVQHEAARARRRWSATRS